MAHTTKAGTLNVMNDLDVSSANQLNFNASDREFMHAVVRRIVRAESDAEDVTQEALLTAYRHRDQFRGESKPRTWLYRVAITSALGYLRKLRRSKEHEGLTRDVIDPADTPEATLATAEQAMIANRLLQDLDPKYRDVVVMRVDHTEVETAERLGITVANVKVRAHRARAQLRALIAA